MTIIHLNTGGGRNLRRKVGCPVCEIADAPTVVSYPGSPYYGPDTTCTCCGDKWSDGELWERPFQRGWRQESIAAAAADWEAACDCPVERDDDLYVLPCQHAEVPA